MDRKRYNDGTFAPDTGRHIAANHVPLPLRALEDPGFDWAIRQVQLFARRAASKSPADGLPALPCFATTRSGSNGTR
jgi:hypothetical protein